MSWTFSEMAPVVLIVPRMGLSFQTSKRLATLATHRQGAPSVCRPSSCSEYAVGRRRRLQSTFHVALKWARMSLRAGRREGRGQSRMRSGHLDQSNNRDAIRDGSDIARSPLQMARQTRDRTSRYCRLKQCLGRSGQDVLCIYSVDCSVVPVPWPVQNLRPAPLVRKSVMNSRTAIQGPKT
jgi:hypothetical protein